MKAVAESAMREIVGQSQIQKILTADRKLIEPASQALMQKVLDDYHSRRAGAAGAVAVGRSARSRSSPPSAT